MGKEFYARNRERILSNAKASYAALSPEEKRKISLRSIERKRRVRIEQGYEPRKFYDKSLSKSEKAKIYYQENKVAILAQRRKRRKVVPLSEEARKKNIQQIIKRRKSSPVLILAHKLRKNITRALASFGLKKSKRTEEILGCSFKFFKAHIESQFKPWMTWANRGLYNGTLDFGWDLDHIIPMSSAKTEEDVIRLNHYTNFQPLCSYVNRFVKKDKLV